MDYRRAGPPVVIRQTRCLMSWNCADDGCCLQSWTDGLMEWTEYVW